MKIQRVRAGQVLEGQSIIDPDDDSLTTDAEVNEAYLADEQDWQLVVATRGHADVGSFLLQLHDGTREWGPSGSWDAIVWRLTDDQGRPIETELDA